MVSENSFITTSGTAIPNETLQGSGTFSKVLLCGTSGNVAIPLTCDSEGKLLFIAAGSQA